MKRCRAILTVFLSMPFAVVLTAGLAALSAVGSLIGTGLPTVRYVERFGVFWADLFIDAGLTRIYRSSVFLAVVGLLALSLFCCLIRQAVSFVQMCCRTPGSRRRETLKDGFWRLAGFFCIHAALLSIGFGALWDWGGGEAVAFSDDRSEKWSEARGFRGRMVLSEGERSNIVRWREGDSVVYRRLPVYIKLDVFEVAENPQGQPGRYTSQLVFFDSDNRFLKKGRLSANRPISFEGMTFYQSGVDYEGTELIAHLRKIQGDGQTTFSANIAVGRVTSLPATAGGGQISVIEYRPANLSEPIKKIPNGERFEQLVSRQFNDLGPSVVFSIRNAEGRDVSVHQFLNPIVADGKSWWVSGIIGDQQRQPVYWRIPNLKNLSLEQFFDLRQAISSPTQQARLVKTVVAVTSAGRVMSLTEKRQFKEAVTQIIRLFGERGLEAVMGRLDEIADENDREKIRQTLVSLLQSVVIAAAPTERRFNLTEINDLLVALSAGRTYDCDWFVVPVFLRENRISIIEVSALPGKYWVYSGFLLFLLGLTVKWVMRKQKTFL